MKTQGLSFKKFDLHVHTPASKCFKDKNVTAKQIVNQAIDQGMNAIAITDHNTGEWIDEVKKAASKKNLVVFPGVEITVGDAHNHIIAILDVSKGTKDIRDLLTSLDIFSPEYGKQDAFSGKSVTKAIDTITRKPFEGLAVLAHVDSTNGVFRQMKGAPRNEVIQYPKLLAAEVVNYEKNAKFLDGTDPQYQRKLAVYQSSDNPCLDKNGKIITTGASSGKHGCEGIGCRYSYLKVDDDICLESLRQCFIDPEVRIRQSFEFKSGKYPLIKSVKINSGFLADEFAEFHPGLNSILGAKGVGKSLLIEFMRFALDQESSQTEIRDDHEEKLREQLGQYGQIEVCILDETGKQFKITRTYNPSEDNPIECRDAQTDQSLDVNVAQLFPTLLLSQIEIIKIAEDPNEQMKFIDKFFDFHLFQNRISNLESELEELDKEFSDSLRAYHKQANLAKQLQTLTAEIARLAEQLKNPVFDEFEKQEEKDKTFRLQFSFLKSIRQLLNDFNHGLEAETIPEIPEKLSSDPALKRTLDHVIDAKTSMSESLTSQLKSIAESMEEIKTE